ncbi:hypothetical protein LCGC14_2979060 [marine sediment metagenome]|uniref:Uncharacterized protein n=1 Tax=marine sediment metagenome TaxID=412755 RepID=A0A0F8X813_9ZZZZ
MKLLFGKETTRELNLNEKEHKIYLEDDQEYKELKIEPQVFCLIPKEELIKVIKFIRDAQILGVDNEAVKLMHKLRDDLIAKIEDVQAEKIINNQH